MSESAEKHSKHHGGRPKEWGVLDATFWSLVAFFLPQFALVPLLGFFDSLPLERNAKVFVLQGLSQLAAVLMLWLVVKRVYHSGPKAIGLAKLNPSLLGWSVLAFPLYMVVSTAISSILAGVFGINLLEHQNIGYSNPNGLEMTLIFVALVVLAPLVEEVLFRGFLFNAFRRTFGFWVGASAVSLLFAIAHGQANVAIDVFVLSMFLCFLREKTGSLWPSIALHALKNLVAFIVLFIIKVN